MNVHYNIVQSGCCVCEPVVTVVSLLEDKMHTHSERKDREGERERGQSVLLKDTPFSVVAGLKTCLYRLN